MGVLLERQNMCRTALSAFFSVFLMVGIASTLLVLASLFNPPVFSLCSDPVLSDATCSNDQTITATFVCGSGSESSRAYTVPWKNITNTSAQVVLETDVGTTPPGTGTPFFESFTCPGNGTMDANVSLIGTNLEGISNFNMVSAGANELVLVNFSVSKEVLVGRTAGFEFTVVDENGKKVSGARCVADVEDGDGVPITAASIDIVTHDGKGVFSGVVSIAALSEGGRFVLTTSCSCALLGSGCWDEDGGNVLASAGSASFVFDVGTWLGVNVTSDKSDYVPGEPLFICANVTNFENRSRQAMDVFYDYRCNGVSNISLNRVVIDSFREVRGISGNTTQTQCAVFRIPDAISIEEGAVFCQATVIVTALNELGEPLVSYPRTTNLFTIVSPDVHPVISWSRVQRLRYVGNASTSRFSGVKDVHLMVPFILDDFNTPAADIDSFSIRFANGSSTPFVLVMEVHTLFKHNSFEDDVIDESSDSVKIVVRDVNTSQDFEFLVTVNLNGGDPLSQPLFFMGVFGVFLIAMGLRTGGREGIPFFGLAGLFAMVFALYVMEVDPFPVFADFGRFSISGAGLLNDLAVYALFAVSVMLLVYPGLGEWRRRRDA